IGLDRELCWSSWANGDDRAPFRKPRTKLIVLRESSAQSVEPLGDRLSWKASERFCSGIDLDAGQDADSRQIDRERLAVLGLLPQRLVIQDDTADVVRQAWSRKQHFAIAAPCLLGPFEPDRLETLRDRAGRLVGSQDTFPFRSHAASDRLKFSAIHNSLQRIRADPTFAIACHARRFLGGA